MSTIRNKTETQNKAKEITETNIDNKEFQTRLELLYEVAQQASSLSGVSQLLEEILRVTQQILHASASVLLLINEEKREFYLQSAGGEKSSILKQIRPGLDSGIIRWVGRNGLPVVANDVYRDNRFDKEVDEVAGFVTKSIIAVPIMRGQNVIGVLEIINKVDGSIFNERDLAVLSGFASTEALVLLVSMAVTAINNIRLCHAMQDEYKITVEALVTAADAKDPYASGHSRRVKEYALLAANSLGFSPDELKVIEFGAMLHDIGKIGISDSILRKPGPLTAEEWYIMRKHTLRGANIVSEIPSLEKTRGIVLYHHERYDGKGYPDGLKGEKIPIGARLVAVADAFDTMLTEHSYRAALSLEAAMNELIAGSGTQFCPIAVEAFVSGFQKCKGKLVKKEAEQAAEEKAKRAAEEAREAKNAEKSEKKAAQQAAREKAKREADEVKELKNAEKLAKKAAQQAAEEKARAVEEAGKVVNYFHSELYEGEVQLAINSYADYEQVNQFIKCLRTVSNLDIVLNGWSEDEGNRIVVSLQKPMALGSILSEMPIVEKVYKKGGDVVVVLKTSQKTE